MYLSERIFQLKTVKLNKMDVQRKKYFEWSDTTANDDIFAILHTVGREDEDEIDNLMNNSDTEFFAKEEINDSSDAENSTLTLQVHN